MSTFSCILRSPALDDVYDLLIIGAGSAAFAAAIRARSLDARVALVEAGTLGGTCVNVGCVPSKYVLEAAQRQHDCPSSDIDLPTVIAEKDDLVAHLRRAKYADLLVRYDLQLFRGAAEFVDKNSIQIAGQTLRAGAYVIATGSLPAVPAIPGLEDGGFLTSTTALDLKVIPPRMGVIGANAIGLELGQYFARIGSSVTIFEAQPQITPAEEPEMSRALAAALRDEDIQIVTGASITGIQTAAKERIVGATVDGKNAEYRFDAILVATGRRPNTSGLNLQSVGVRVAPSGAVIVQDSLQTDNPRIYAAGDVTGGPQFVYVAAYQGGLAAENALNQTSKPQSLGAVPRVIFTQPRLAAVGETEKQARARGVTVQTAMLELGGNVPRAIVNGRGGSIKIVATGQERKILGVHMVGDHADEVIQAATYAVKFGLTVEQIVDTFHPYLTMAESLRLCAQTFDRDPGTLSCCAV